MVVSDPRPFSSSTVVQSWHYPKRGTSDDQSGRGNDSCTTHRSSDRVWSCRLDKASSFEEQPSRWGIGSAICQPDDERRTNALPLLANEVCSRFPQYLRRLIIVVTSSIRSGHCSSGAYIGLSVSKRRCFFFSFQDPFVVLLRLVWHGISGSVPWCCRVV